MEEIDASVSEKSNILEQSYCEGVKRIAHQRNSDFFQVSKHIIKKRQIAWSKLFDKYDKEIDDYEIKMYESDSDVDENRKEEEKKSDHDADEVEEKFYFVKDRTPIRKIPALVQYWVDTGNPPYQLNLENDTCDSSLSEDQKSSPLIIRTRSEIEGKRDHSTSFLSSVDTVAYILSNTNVTKKADTLAIVEGAKESDSSIETNNMILNASKGCLSTIEVTNTANKDNHKITSGKTIDSTNGVNRIAIKSHLLTALNPNNLKNKKLTCKESCDKVLDNLIMQTSVKITDVLPTLEQLDKTLNGNLSDNDNDELSNIISLKGDYSSTISQPFVRKKLYTNRESPIEIIMSNPITSIKPKFSANVLHPALQGTPTVSGSRSYFRRRTLRYSRKRKSIANNNFKRLSDKSNNSSSRTRKSNRKKSNKKSITSNHSMIKDSEKNSVMTIDDSHSRNNRRKEELIELCKKMNLIVKLEKLPDNQLISGNRQIKDFEKSNEKLLKDDADIFELDSQESDQSTIIICPCSNNRSRLSHGDNRTYSDNESMHSENKSSRKSQQQSRQHLKKSTELLNEGLQNIDKQVLPDESKEIITDDDASSDVFIGTFNKIAAPSVLSEILDLPNREEKQSLNLNKSVKVTDNVIRSSSPQNSINSENSEDQSWNLQLTFSSDEEDDFIQMIRQKTEVTKIRQTQTEDKSAEDSNKTGQALNSYKNESNLPCKFGVIASSDDEEKKIIKADNISVQKRKSRRIYSRIKNVTPASSDDEAVKIETTSKRKRKSTISYGKKFNEHSVQADIKNISPQNSTRKTSHINGKLNNSQLDLSENITPPKKLKTTPDDTSNGDQKKAMNDINSINEPTIPLKEDFSLIKKNLNDLITQDLTMKPDRTFQSKRQRRSNRKSKNDNNVSEREDHEIKCSPKENMIMKKCSISIVKYSNPSEDAVDSGLSSIMSSKDKTSQQILNKKLEYSDDLKNISPIKKRNINSLKSLRRKSSISTSIQRRLSKSVKKLIKKRKSILLTNENSSDDDIKPRTRRQSAINKSKSSNSTNARKEQNFDTIFPDPINDTDVLEVPEFPGRSRRSQSQNDGKSHIDKTSSSSSLRNSQRKFHTGMCSDSD